MKKKLIFITVIAALTSVLVTGYIGYGATMINPDSEKSIINHLSSDKNNPINILASEKYGNSFLILYEDPVTKEENQYNARLSRFVKHKLYPNRYEYKGGSLGRATQIQVDGMMLNDEKASDENKVAFVIANTASKETRCSVFESNQFELDEDLYIKKIDELKVPQEPYIIIREYTMKNKKNELLVYDGSIDLKDLGVE